MDTTKELVRRYQIGEPGARAELLAHEIPWLRQNLERRLGDRLKQLCGVDDLLQDTVVKALEYAPKFAGDQAQFRALLLRIGLNLAITAARHMRAGKRDARKSAPLPSTTTPGSARPVDTVTRPESKARSNEERRLVMEAMRQLSASHREVLELHFAGLTDGQIAERLGISGDAAESRRRRAMESLASQTLGAAGGSKKPRGQAGI